MKVFSIIMNSTVSTNESIESNKLKIVKLNKYTYNLIHRYKGIKSEIKFIIKITRLIEIDYKHAMMNINI